MPQLTAPELNRVFNNSRLSNAPAKKNNTLQYLLLGVLLILLISGAARFFLQNKQDTARIRVVAAAQDIPAGCKIDFGALHYLTIPKQYERAEMFSSYEQLLGQTSSAYIRKGNPICKKDLLAAGSLGRSLGKNQRAITLRLDAEMQVDHCLQTGDKVDVLVTVQAQGHGKSASKKYTKTVCQNLTVLLSTPREASLSKGVRANDSNRVTLAAAPVECEQLSQAAETGKLRLVLRNYMYQSPVMLSGADERDLIPAYALKEMATEEMNQAKAKEAVMAAAQSPAPAAAVQAAFPSLPANPIAYMQEKVAEPLQQWVVEMFSGSKKENYAIPLH